MSVRSYALILSCVLSAQSVACGDEPKTDAKASPTDAKAKKKSRKDKAPEEVAQKEPTARFELPIDFNDSARTRDPFLSYAREFADEAKKRVRSQREVVLDQYALDELKLAGLVTGIRPARAMLIDPTKKGHVVHEGQFVGRSEVVQGGASGADYEINWRIDRIRDTDIVLVREDPANPDVPSATRVILLRPDDVVAAAM
jgi:type IV pilus assembly protein PilP